MSSVEIGKNMLTAIAIVAIATVSVVMMLTDHVSVGLITGLAGAFGLIGKSISQDRG